MCGITGAISLNGSSVNASYAKPMADKIAHRGPDDAGYLFLHTGAKADRNITFFLNLTDNKFKHLSQLLPAIENSAVQHEINQHDWDIYLGHRRLSILDTSPAGHQPMSDLSKNIWLVYNGEIYNFKEIRTELERLGHRFKTGTDTEVIIYAYIEWGIDSIERFNGMFAFSLYDNFKKKLYLVRDRYGIKPLYYTVSSKETLIFASEIKSIIEYKEYATEMDCDALLEYFTFQNIYTDKTLHKNIKLLAAGHYLEIDLNRARPRLNTTQYWDFSFIEPEHAKDPREYNEELDRLFCQAVNRQLIADVDVGSYLSGGMDSGSITAIAARSLPYIKTFTIGFDLTSASGMEISFDERVKAEHMSYKFKTEHYEMVLKSGDMERCMGDFAYHLEEPRVGQSYPNYYAAKLASKFVKVVLSGAGGDELFAGYPWRYYQAVNNDDFDHYINNYYSFWKRLLSDDELERMFSPLANQLAHVSTKDIFSNIFRGRAGQSANHVDYINHSLYFEAKTFLHGILVVEDKLSMAHSLENRVPFLDNDLVDFSQNIPVSMKLANLDKVINIDENVAGNKQINFKKTGDGKLLLRSMMRKYIPDDIASGEKQGFSSPDQSWFKGDSIEYVKEKLLNNNARIYNYFDKNTVHALVNQHLCGDVNRRLYIWSLLNLEEWCSIYG